MQHWILPLLLFPIGPLVFFIYQKIQFAKGNDKVFAWGATAIVFGVGFVIGGYLLMYNLGYWA